MSLPPRCIVVSVLEPDLERTLARARTIPRRLELVVELRGDHLTEEELGRAIVELDRPTIVTLRRPADGGTCELDEAERGRRLSRALDISPKVVVDVEHDGPHSKLGDPERRILSIHLPGPEIDRIDEMRANDAARLKIVTVPERLIDLAPLKQLCDARTTAFGMGRIGKASRILAPSWGGWGTYGAPDAQSAAAPGQLPWQDLLELWNVLSIGPMTRRFALIGGALELSPSAAMHAAAYRAHELDAVYLPIDADDLDDVRRAFAPDGPIAVEAFGVTMPFKREAAEACVERDAVAVNTVRCGPDGWLGTNTDAVAAIAAIDERVAEPTRVAILGNGGTALAVEAALRQRGDEVIVLARRPTGDQQPWERCPTIDAEVWVHATPLGREGELPFEPAAVGAKLVLDFVYARQPTPLARACAEAGIPCADGQELLVRQGVEQFRVMTGRQLPAETMRVACRSWLAAR